MVPFCFPHETRLCDRSPPPRPSTEVWRHLLLGVRECGTCRGPGRDQGLSESSLWSCSQNSGPDASYTRVWPAFPPTGGVRLCVCPGLAAHLLCDQAQVWQPLCLSMSERCAGIPRGKMMNGCPSRTEQPQEPDPRTSHAEEDLDRASWKPRGEHESEANSPPASQVALLPERAQGWKPEGCRTQAWVIPLLSLEPSF